MDAFHHLSLIGQHEFIVLGRRDEPATGKRRRDQNRVDSALRLSARQVSGPRGVGLEDGMHLARIIEHVHQRLFVAK